MKATGTQSSESRLALSTAIDMFFRQCLKEAVRMLAESENLPLEYRDYSLSEDDSGHRECHITSNLVACLYGYRKKPDTHIVSNWDVKSLILQLEEGVAVAAAAFLCG